MSVNGILPVMIPKISAYVIVVLFLSFVCSTSGMADITFNMWGAPAEVRIRVGAESGVTTVTHDVPAVNLGDGTPIVGTPNLVFIEASARRANFWDALLTYFIVSVDSSTPLSNGIYSIPFTTISWRSEDGSIPSGRFNGTASQVILEATRAISRVSDHHTFTYDNLEVVPHGTYTGSVTYTVSIP